LTRTLIFLTHILSVYVYIFQVGVNQQLTIIVWPSMFMLNAGFAC